LTGRSRLIVFDVDGTLVDSQHDIVAAMAQAFARADMAPPSRAQVLGIVGLSLDHAIGRLAPALPPAMHARMTGWYKEAYIALRSEAGAAESSPLYPHVGTVLSALGDVPSNLLGVATGKSRRGLDTLLLAHGLARRFVTTQVSDDHPSKPHPSTCKWPRQPGCLSLGWRGVIMTRF